MTGAAIEKNPAPPPETDNRTVEFDIGRMSIGPQGVEGFFWPCPPKDDYKFVKHMLEDYAALMLEHENFAVVPYKLFAKNFIVEAKAVFAADRLAQGLSATHVRLQIPGSWRIWPALLQGRAPEFPAFMDDLKNGPQKAAARRNFFDFGRLKRIASRLRPRFFREGGGRMTIDGLLIGRITPERLQNSIIATQRYGLISAHAASCGRDVYFMRSDRFFRGIDDAAFKDAKDRRLPGLEEKIMDLVRRQYERAGGVLSAAGEAYLSALLTEGAACLRVHHERLIAAKETLPRHIWTGTGGYIWDMLLRLAVIEAGGVAEGHSHGCGEAHLDEYSNSFLELWGSQRFNCFSEAEAAAIRDTAPRHPRLQREMPDITAVKTATGQGAILPKMEQRPVKTVMIVGTPYDRDRGRMIPLMPDIVYVDWHARLISQLKSFGYDVLLKPHPESPLPPPAAFTETLGARIESRPFEDVMAQADLILFDFIYTTTFRTAVISDRAIVTIDFDNTFWYEKALPAVDLRLCRVSGRYDENNRAQVDWKALQTAIGQAPGKAKDETFARQYML